MSSPSNIIKNTSHRPWDLTKEQWQYYQEWNRALFLHWQVPVDIIKPLVPASLDVDVIEGKTWVSLVAFTMEKIRPRNFPALPVISNFHEINLRTYVSKENKQGVYFLSIEAQKFISVLIAKSLSGLPYEKSKIQRTQHDDVISYTSCNDNKNFHLDTTFKVKQDDYHKTELDKWLTERYCLYFEKGVNLYRYEIHHEEWNLKNIEMKKLHLNYQKGDLAIKNRQPDLAHFSDGVKVLAWVRQKL